jgi:hypothetical protein
MADKQVIKQKFKRKTGANLKQVPEEQFQIRHDLGCFSGDSKEVINRRRKATGKWYRISSEHQSIYRYMRFNPNLSSSDIMIDWDGWILLNNYGKKFEDSIELTIRKIKLHEALPAVWNMSSPSARLTTRTALFFTFVGLVLGLVGYIL